MPPAPSTRSGAVARVPRGLPEAVAFLASFCVMVIELVAGRIISRHLGSSIYTWTSVIGIVLAGLAVGNALGGRLADRFPAVPTLSKLFLAGSAASLVVLVANTLVGEWVALWTLSWPVRIVLHVGLVFFLPSIVLGMISPVASKMAVERGAATGRALGNVSAWGVVGSILGTFCTGYWFVAAFGTTQVVWGVAATLALAGLLLGARSKAAHVWTGVFLALGALGAAPTHATRGFAETIGLREARSPRDIYVDDSQYQHIRIASTSEHPDRLYMHLDKLVHSTVLVDKPLELQYGYERIYSGTTRLLSDARDSLNTLTVGGGGYTYPRYLDLAYPRSRTEVVEIDPAVTRAAIAAFGLPADNRLIIQHEDGRAFLQGLVERRRLGTDSALYDFIYVDVFNDYSVPYQLTTLEFLRDVEAVLAPRGAFMMNMIDVFGTGQFLGPMLHTMREVFPEVHVFSEGRPAIEQPTVRNTFVIIGSRRAWDPAPMIASYDPKVGLSEVSESAQADLLKRSSPRLLTDDWAPIENFLAPVVRQASRDIASSELTDRALKQMRDGKKQAALHTFERAIRLHPIDVNARREYAIALVSAGDVEGAIKQYREVLRIRPGLVAPRVQLASFLARVGRVDEGLREVEEAIRREPTLAQAWLTRGVLLESVKRPEEAIASYAESVRLEPKNLEARNNLGIVLARTGRKEEARRAFEEVLAIDPKFAKARQNLQHLASAAP